MKFFLKFFGIIALLILGFVIFYNLREKGAKAVPGATWLMEPQRTVNNNSAPAPAPAAAPRPNIGEAVRASVTKAHVELLSMKEQPGSVVIKVQWKGDNQVQGADVLDDLIAQGAIRDFDQIGSGVHYVNSAGQSVHTLEFRLYPR